MYLDDTKSVKDTDNYIERLIRLIEEDPYSYYTEVEIFETTREYCIEQLEKERKFKNLEEASNDILEKEYNIER